MTRILLLIVAFCLMCGHLCRCEAGERVRIESKILNISFVPPLPNARNLQTIKPIHAWNDGEQFGFEMRYKSNPVFLSFNIQKNSKPIERNPERALAAAMKEARESYVNPIIKVSKVVNFFDQTVIIMTSTGVGGESGSAVIGIPPNYRISIAVSASDEWTGQHLKRKDFCDCVESVIRSLDVSKM